MKKELGESDKEMEKEEDRETKMARKGKKERGHVAGCACRACAGRKERSKKRVEYDAKDEKEKGVAKGGPTSDGEVSDRKPKKRKMTLKEDTAYDKKHGIKEHSKEDEKMDKEHGVKDRKHRIGTKANVALGEKPTKKHAPAFNSPAGYRKMAQRINNKGVPQGQPNTKGLKAGLAEYERQQRHGR